MKHDFVSNLFIENSSLLGCSSGSVISKYYPTFRWA